MKSNTFTAALVLSASVIALGGCNAPPNQPAPEPGRVAEKASPPPMSSPVSINAVMVSLVDHAGHALWDVEQEGKRPKTSAEWELVAEHATQLAAAGALISLPGTGVNDVKLTQQPNWQKWSRAMSDAGLAAMRASKAEDMKALLTANGQLVEACESCHKEYKPEIPSEGILHKHMHVAP